MSNLSKYSLFILIPVFLAGCQLKRPVTSQLPSPEPTASPSVSSIPLELAATMSATPATVSAVPTTKGGIPLTSKKTPTVTAKAPSTSPSLYDVSFDSLEVTNYPSQTQNATLTLKNNSNQPVLWYIKLDQVQSKTYPINVNGTNEVTGSIGAHSSTAVSIGTQNTDPDPDFVTTIRVVLTSGNTIVATKPIKITVHSPASERFEIHTTDDANTTINFKAYGSYGITIKNTHGKNLNWTASIEAGGDRLRLSNDNGYFLSDSSAYTTLYFTTGDRGGLTQAKVVFKYSDDNHNNVVEHTLTIHIQ